MKRLLVTGSRHGWDEHVLHVVLDVAYTLLNDEAGDEVVLVHGAAPGVDTQAAAYWAAQGRPVEAHEALWRERGPAAGPIRNSEMVAAGADLCVAFGSGRGTSDCASKAEAAGIEVRWVTK